MATVNLFYDPVFSDGAFTANDPRVRAYAVQKTMRAMDLGAELGAKIFVLWGGREGTETDACRRPDEAVKRLREAINYLVRVLDRQEVRLPLRARGQAERAARRHLHGDDRRLSRVHPDARPSGDGRREPRGRARDDGRPELPPRGRPGVGSRQAVPHRPERSEARPLRPGLPLRRRQPASRPSSWSSSSRTSATTGRATSTRTPTGPRTTTGVKDFARGCMRTYLILKERAERWNADAEIQALVQEARSARYGRAGVRQVFRRQPRRAARGAARPGRDGQPRPRLREAGSADDGGPLRRAVGWH